jgi:uncharacterized membrane protein
MESCVASMGKGGNLIMGGGGLKSAGVKSRSRWRESVGMEQANSTLSTVSLRVITYRGR